MSLAHFTSTAKTLDLLMHWEGKDCFLGLIWVTSYISLISEEQRIRKEVIFYSEQEERYTCKPINEALINNLHKIKYFRLMDFELKESLHSDMQDWLFDLLNKRAKPEWEVQDIIISIYEKLEIIDKRFDQKEIEWEPADLVSRNKFKFMNG